jgi:hypothetical protein
MSKKICLSVKLCVFADNKFSNRQDKKSAMSDKNACLRTTVLEKLVYILIIMNETSILHLAGGKVTLQARRAVNQSKTFGQFVYLFVIYFSYLGSCV